MEEKKLIDKEIIKAFKNCMIDKDGDCPGCPYDTNRIECGRKELMRDVFNIVQRQKSEIERLKIDLEHEKNWGKIQTKQAVKDTADKIYKGLCEEKRWKKLKDAWLNLYTGTSEELAYLLYEITGVEVEE